MDGVAAWRDAELLRTDPGERTQIAGLERVGANHCFLGFDDFLVRERQLHLENLCRVEQPAGVFMQAEDRGAIDGVVGPYTLEDRHAVMQRVGQDMDLGIAPVHQFAIEPDVPVAVSHRHV